MTNFTYAFILSSIAGISTLLGLIPLLFNLKNEQKIITTSLAFASGVMIFVSLSDLIPESFQLLKTIFKPFPALIILLIFITTGIIISLLIDKLIPESKENIKNKKLYHIGLVSMLAIIMHNIPEGIATFLSSSTNKSLGLSLAFAISLHNIPEGISIAIPIYFSTKNKLKAFIYTLISSLSEPFGALLAFLFLRNIMNNFIMSIILALIAGIMLYIALYDLLKEAIKSKKYQLTITFFIIGVLFMITSHFILS